MAASLARKELVPSRSEIRRVLLPRTSSSRAELANLLLCSLLFSADFEETISGSSVAPSPSVCH